MSFPARGDRHQLMRKPQAASRKRGRPLDLTDIKARSGRWRIVGSRLKGHVSREP